MDWSQEYQEIDIMFRVVVRYKDDYGDVNDHIVDFEEGSTSPGLYADRVRERGFVRNLGNGREVHYPAHRALSVNKFKVGEDG